MYFDPRIGLALVTLDVEEGDPLKRIKTPCGVVVSPASPAQVIVREPDGLNLVFDAAYGSLPDGTLVVAVKNASGAFPEGTLDLDARVILDPYQTGLDTPEVLDPKLSAWGGGCPVCGKLAAADLKDFGGGDDWTPGGDDDEDGDDDWTPGGDDDEDGGAEEAPAEIPMPRRFVYEQLVAPCPN